MTNETLITVDLRPDGPLYKNFTLEDLIKKGVSDSDIEQAFAQERAKVVSKECRRRIYSVASAETQMNMAAASSVTSAKSSSSRTDPEKAVLAGLEAAIGWVGAMRGAATMLAADPEKDFTADEHWPDVPAAAAAVVDQF